MKKQNNNLITIHAPRSLVIIFVQYMSLSALFPALMIITVGLPSNWHGSSHDRCMLLIVLIVLFVVGFVMIYFPQRHITRLVFNPKTKSLTKLKHGDDPLAFDLTSALRIVLKTIYTNPGLKYLLSTEDCQGQTQIVFDEDIFSGGVRLRWVALSKKLSHITGVPVKFERWVEDMNGNLKETQATIVRRNLVVGLIPIVIAFVGAALFRIQPSPRSFLYVGLSSVALNITLSFIYVCLKKDEMSYPGKSHLSLGLYVLTLVIPYIMLYLMFVFLLNGFRLPV